MGSRRLAGRNQYRSECCGDGIPCNPEFRLHRQRPLATIIPPRHGSRGRCGRGRTSYSGMVGRALYRRDANRQHGRHFCARREILAGVSAVAAEDTRHSGRLLRELGLERPLISLHEHNERARVAELVARLRGGESIALVSDAGTPLVSDPGYLLVAAAIESGIVVTPIPGPSAAIAALSASGCPAIDSVRGIPSCACRGAKAPARGARGGNAHAHRV